MGILTSHIYSKLRMIQRFPLRLHKSSKHKETTIDDKRMHPKHDENLKSQWKDYHVDLSEDSSAICISTRQEIDFSEVKGLPRAYEEIFEFCERKIDWRRKINIQAYIKVKY